MSSLREAWDQNGNLMVTNGDGLFEEQIEKTGVLRYGNYKDGFVDGIWTDEGTDGKVQVLSEYGEYGTLLWSQKGENTIEEAKAEVESMPQFPGGHGAWNRFLKRNMKYPREASRNGIQGQVGVTFTVLLTGEITNIKISKRVHSLLDAEARRVVRLSPNWTPALQEGHFLDREMTIELLFKSL